MKLPSRVLPIAVMILIPAVFRLYPYVRGALGLADIHDPASFIWTFSPVAATFLFGGAVFADRRWAYLAPLLAMLLSDLGIILLTGELGKGFHAMTPVMYATYAVMIWIGTRLGHAWRAAGDRNRFLKRFAATAGAGVLCEAVFYVVTNFATWAMPTGYYPHTFAGLVECYVVAIPFARALATGMAIYATLMFGCLALVEWRFGAARLAAAAFPENVPANRPAAG